MDLEAVAAEWARRREDVRALVLVGSRARSERPADEWSDYDLVAVVDDAGPFLRSADWVDELAPVLLSFVEATATFARGYRVLVDKGVLGPFPTELPATGADALPVHEFWYRALLSARKLRRGELHVAVQGCNCGLRTLLRRALEIDARAAGRDAWHEGRFLERWADPRWLARMPATVAAEDPAAAAAAIRAACELFADICAAQSQATSIDIAAVRAHLDAALSP